MRKPSPSDLTDEQWAILAPLIPVHTVGRPRTNDLQEVLNAIADLNRPGCRWDRLPHDLPPRGTAHDSYLQWRSDGTWQEILDAVRRTVRVAAGKGPSPSAGSLASQTVQATSVADSRGNDGGKRVTGRKRHILVGTPGLLLVVVVMAASDDDGTSAPKVLSRLTAEHRTGRKLLWADGKDHNRHLRGWMAGARPGDRIGVVSRPPPAQTVRWSCPVAGWWDGRPPGWAATGGTVGATSGAPGRARR